MLAPPLRSALVLGLAFSASAAAVSGCSDDAPPPLGSGGGTYQGAGVPIPGTLEAEAFVAAAEVDQDFDEQDAACTSEVDPTVDLLATVEGGCAIGYTGPGEWWEYLVYSETGGRFDVQLHVGTGMSAELEFTVDGGTPVGVEIPATSWEEFSDVRLVGLDVPPGEHTLRLAVASGAANIDRFTVLVEGECPNGCDGRACGMDDCGNECGTCADGETCSVDFACLDAAACAATCGEKICGSNDCGGSCGTCEGALVCTPTGSCWDGSVTPVARHGQLRVSGTNIVDEHDVTTQLKGISTQWLNWEQQYASSSEAMQWLRDNWALSVWRIANGVENSNGYLEEPTERLELVESIIDRAIDNEVYVIVDWHTHEPDHVEEAKAFFSAIAEKYGDAPNVIYEIFNEPLELDWSTELKPLHEEVVAAIRAHDPDNLIIAGTPEWDQHPEAVIGDRIDDDNLLYTVHFYACTHQAWLRDNADEAIAAGLPLFITEWGGTHADGGTEDNPGVCEGATRDWHVWMEENDVSWAAWKLSDDNDSSALLAPNAPVEGGWTDDDLHGHAYLVHEFMMDER